MVSSSTTAASTCCGAAFAATRRCWAARVAYWAEIESASPRVYASTNWLSSVARWPQCRRALLKALKHWRGPATGYDKLAVTYRGGAVLAARS